MSEMVEVKVGGLLPDRKNPGSHILLLKVPGSTRFLPIWIGPVEANAIAMALRNQAFERPLTHDLLQHVIDGLGATVKHVVITTIQDSTFYARIVLERGRDIVSVDARPSDSVALAVRVHCPIFLTEALLESQEGHLIEINQESLEPDSEPAAKVESPTPEGSLSEESLEELMRRVERGEAYPSRPDSDEDPEDEDEED